MADVVPAFVQSSIDRLRQLVQRDAIESWRVCETDCSIEELPSQAFTRIELNEKRYLVWEKGHEVRWFYQEWRLPAQLQGYPLSGLTLRLALTWWAEFAQVYVNGQLVQEGDLFDHSCRVVLSSESVENQFVSVAIRLISPSHDIGGLMRSTLLYESNYDQLDPGFVADELAVLTSYLTAFEPEKIETVEAAIAQISWEKVSDRISFNQSLESLRNSLSIFSSNLKKHTLFLLGHAHLDLAWLWDTEETWRAAERTFKSVLNLQRDFPELTFCHTTPALYEWIEKNRPEIFAQIVEGVKTGRWEIVGGMWVEPELNLISGESIARQILYGQRYCEEKFGAISRVAWLPDTFGFNWQLPQFLKQGGIDYFVTQKLRWNDTNQYPHEVFHWQAPDGSRIPSFMSAPIGEGIDPIKMSAYAWEWTKRTGDTNALWLPGVGDHGGGPTRDMLEIARRWARSPFFPNLEFTTAIEYLEQLDKQSLPVWNDEIYLEFHRGCYTTHGDQKKFNRESESRLYEIELWSSLATLLAAAPYPKANLETAWKIVLFNQFHDILPGSSIYEVYQDAFVAGLEFKNICDDISGERTLAEQIKLSEPPHPFAQAIVVFNPCNWQRSMTVRSRILQSQSKGQHWKVCDLDGQELPIQVGYFSTELETGKMQFYEVVFQAENIPSVGYRCFWLCPIETTTAKPFIKCQPNEFVLENQFLKVIVDPTTGDLVSVFDKAYQREILNGAGNQLQAYQDSGQYWDAWNIDPNYAEHPLDSSQLISIQNRLWFDLIPSIDVERRLGNSIFRQRYFLNCNSPILQIYTQVDWKERHVIVKAAFPMTVESDYVTYEIPGGVIQKTTKPQTTQEKVKWEVPALGWIDLSDDNYGVSILSDCKHGYDCQSNQLRLTLLRGSEFPDPKADLGSHEFTYAIYPHAGTWQTAQTTRKVYDLRECEAVTLEQASENATLPPVGSFLDLQCENLIVTALKQSEDNPDEWILRCYECHGKPAELKLKSDFGLILGEPVDLLERPTHDSTQIQPWQVRSFRLKTERGAPKHTSID